MSDETEHERILFVKIGDKNKENVKDYKIIVHGPIFSKKENKSQCEYIYDEQFSKFDEMILHYHTNSIFTPYNDSDNSVNKLIFYTDENNRIICYDIIIKNDGDNYFLEIEYFKYKTNIDLDYIKNHRSVEVQNQLDFTDSYKCLYNITISPMTPLVTTGGKRRASKPDLLLRRRSGFSPFYYVREANSVKHQNTTKKRRRVKKTAKKKRTNKK